MIRHLILFSVFVFDFSGDVSSKPALNELHKPPIIKGNNFKIKHDIKLEILLFSIVKLDTSFYCVCVPIIIIHISVINCGFFIEFDFLAFFKNPLLDYSFEDFSDGSDIWLVLKYN